MRKIFFVQTAIPILFFVTVFALAVPKTFAAVTITTATGGTNISADKAANATSPAFTTLGNIVVTSHANNDFPKNATNATVTFTAPSGWALNPGVGTGSVSGSNITFISISVTSSTITFTYTRSNSNSSTAAITISGVQVRSTAGGTLPDSGNITKTASTQTIVGLANGTVVGSLSQIVGAANDLSIATQPSSAATAGVVFTTQPAVNIRDQFNNVRTTANGASDNTTIVTAARSTGTATLQGTLTATASNGTATFTNLSYLKAETMTIGFTSGALTGATSNNVVVSAGAFNKLQLLMPGESASAGSVTGKTGTPTAQTVGTAFNVTVNAVDANWNAVSSTNMVGITSSDSIATLPADVALVAGTKTFAVTLNTAGTKTVTATDITDGTKTANTSSATTVNKATTATVVATSGSPAVYGQTVTFTATITPGSGGPPTGIVTFKDGATVIGTGTLNGANPGVATYSTTTLSVSGSPHSITAVYAGDNNYSGSTSSSISQNITAKSLTITGITASNKQYDQGTSATLAGTPGTLVGVISGDTVSLTGTAIGTFASANVGTGISVAVSGQSLTGAQAGNYSLTEPTLTASITSVNPMPTISSVSPSSKNVGDAQFTLTVDGTNFIASSTVDLNGSPRTTTFASSTELTAVIPSTDLTAATSSALITVANPAPGGGTSNPQTFTIITTNPTPAITSISPTSVTVDSTETTLTIDGSDFMASTTVQFNGSNLATTTLASSTEMTALIPATSLTATSSNSITATNPSPGGGVSNAKTFSVTAVPQDTTAPTVTAFGISATSTSLTVSVSTFTATDDTGVTGYVLTEASSAPSSGASGWSASAPTSYTFSSQGSKTLYAWAKDAAGNISVSASASTTITFVEVNAGQESNLLSSGALVPGGAATSTDHATFAQETHVLFGGGTTVIIPNATVMTAGTSTDWTQIISTTNISTGDLPTGYTSAGALEWGLPSQSISLSHPATIQIAVGTSRNGQTLTVFKQEAGHSEWTQSTTCVVGNGICEFTTTSFSSFIAALFQTSSSSAGAAHAGAVRPTTVQISGTAYPGAKIVVIEKSPNEERPIDQDVVTAKDGSFDISFVGILQSPQYFYALHISDAAGRLSSVKAYHVDTTGGDAPIVIRGILAAPTIAATRPVVTRGDAVKVVGYATPGYRVRVAFDNDVSYETKSAADGTYSILMQTAALSFGSHTLRAKQINGVTKKESDLSVSTDVIVSSVTVPIADLNHDGVIDIRDFSIFMSRPADMNGDGKVDISDFSIFLRAYNATIQ